MPPVSKIAKLPAAKRQWLHRLFVEHAYGDIEAITAMLNDELRAEGLHVTIGSIGKTAVGAESQRVRRAQMAIRATTEAARLIAESSRDDGDSRSEAAMAIVQGEFFDVLLTVQQAEGETDSGARIKLMNHAALGLSRLSRARVNQARWSVEVEQRAKSAAEAVAKITKTGGLTQAQQDEIRNRILGVAAPRAAATQPHQTGEAR